MCFLKITGTTKVRVRWDYKRLRKIRISWVRLDLIVQNLITRVASNFRFPQFLITRLLYGTIFCATINRPLCIFISLFICLAVDPVYSNKHSRDRCRYLVPSQVCFMRFLKVPNLLISCQMFSSFSLATVKEVTKNIKTK